MPVSICRGPGRCQSPTVDAQRAERDDLKKRGVILFDLGFFRMRRTAVRDFVREGLPQTVAMKLTAHLTDSVFRRYDIVNPNDLRVAAERLARRG